LASAVGRLGVREWGPGPIYAQNVLVHFIWREEVNQVPENRAVTADSDYSIELYKSLRAELVNYIEKIPAIWFQKFVLVGAAVAFLGLHYKTLATASQSDSKSILGAAMIGLSVLAMLLDAKAAEYALHARVVSKFIELKFYELPHVREWEAVLWGDEGEGEVIKMARLRSRVTSLVTSAPTVLLLALTVLGLAKLYGGKIPAAYLAILVPLFAYYLFGGLYLRRVIWPAREIQVEDAPSPGPAGASS